MTQTSDVTHCCLFLSGTYFVWDTPARTRLEQIDIVQYKLTSHLGKVRQAGRCLEGKVGRLVVKKFKGLPDNYPRLRG